MARVSDIGLDLLDAAAAALAAPPARQVFTIGTDTQPLKVDQLAVSWMRTFRGVPGQSDLTPEYDYTETVAEYAVRLTRCFPTSTGAADTPADVVTDAATALADESFALVAALYDWRPPNEHTASGRDDSPSSRWVGPAVAQRPSGFAHAAVVAVHAIL